MAEISKTIKYATIRLNQEDERERRGVPNTVQYWAAYIDGAIAQAKEDETRIAELVKEEIEKIKEDQPVDAVPVVHGKWTTKRTWEHDGELYCSVCGKSVDAYNDIRWADKMYNYCPNCGARMKGANDEQD